MNRRMEETAKDELLRLANFVDGFAEARDSDQLRDAAKWLRKAADNICAQGYFGCEGGDDCDSDHK